MSSHKPTTRPVTMHRILYNTLSSILSEQPVKLAHERLMKMKRRGLIKISDGGGLAVTNYGASLMAAQEARWLRNAEDHNRKKNSRQNASGIALKFLRKLEEAGDDGLLLPVSSNLVYQIILGRVRVAGNKCVLTNRGKFWLKSYREKMNAQSKRKYRRHLEASRAYHRGYQRESLRRRAKRSMQAQLSVIAMAISGRAA